MESLPSLKPLRRRLVWSIYCCFCFSFLFFCAFYTYSVHQNSLFHSVKYAKHMAVTPSRPTGGVDPVFPLSGKITASTLSSKLPHASVEAFSGTAGSVPMFNFSSSLSSSSGLEAESSETSAFLDTKDLVPVTGAGPGPSGSPGDDLGDFGETSDQWYVPSNASSALTLREVGDLPVELGCRSRTSKPKLILLWTPFFGAGDYFYNSVFESCDGCTNCRATSDRSRLLESDAVVFHARDMSAADVPTVRKPAQRWVFYCLESPPYSDFPGLHYMQGMFNWTMTYRSDSDIVTGYGSFEKVVPGRKLDRAALQESWEMKSKSVVWMTSHCPTHGGRDSFVSQLKKYIDVDEYGKCGTEHCPLDSTDECMQKFASTYKFFLAFENSICKDYVTEKFFRVLKYNMVPVVFGGAKYRKYAPPGSYIDALAFKSPKHLAYFLTGVGGDFSLYSTYFEWRKDYVVKMDSKKECALCSHLHKRDQKTSVYQDIRKWWVLDGGCRTWKAKG